jgi:hypothetical protein
MPRSRFKHRETALARHAGALTKNTMAAFIAGKAF